MPIAGKGPTGQPAFNVTYERRAAMEFMVDALVPSEAKAVAVKRFSELYGTDNYMLAASVLSKTEIQIIFATKADTVETVKPQGWVFKKPLASKVKRS